MKRPVVLALLAVLAAAAVYLLLIRDDADGIAANRDPASAQATRPDRQEAPRRAPDPSRQPVRGDAPALEDGLPTADPREGSRDHRTEPHGEFVRPALPHRSKSLVDGRVTAAVMRAVRPVVAGCLSKVPDSAYGDRAAVMTSAVISIDGAGNLTVLALTPALRDIDEAAGASAVECIRAAAPSVHAQVDHAAVAQTTVAVTVRPRANRP